jgi:CRP/FNR family transcriptional regulator, cyclic AMP receptor protein
MGTNAHAMALLEADPELTDGMPEEVRTAATRMVVVRALALEPGPWIPDPEPPQEPAIGLLITDGLITRDITFAGRTTTELLGPGDLIRPWDHDHGFEPAPVETAWYVHEPARVAVLDARFAVAMRRFPTLGAQIAVKGVRRARNMAFQLAIAQLPRVEDRLVVLLWNLAERFGRVSPDGVKLTLPLTHRVLATLVGARRPSVTTALTGLSRAGLVERDADGWLLHGDPDEILRERLLDGASDDVAATAG